MTYALGVQIRVVDRMIEIATGLAAAGPVLAAGPERSWRGRKPWPPASRLLAWPHPSPLRAGMPAREPKLGALGVPRPATAASS